MEFNYRRTERLIGDAVEAFDLNLEDLTVYTEAASGGFAATAALAIAAEAETVYALARDSAYGPAVEAREHTERLAAAVGDEQRLTFPEERNSADFRETDILTNTGFVRPIDDRIADWLGPTAAVPLMYEPWEFRDTDLDVKALWSEGVPILGTDERDERLGTQRYLRALAPKLCFECNLEVYRGEFLVLGDGRMARHAADGLNALGGSVTLANSTGDPEHDGVRINDVTANTFRALDALFIVDHRAENLLVGNGGVVDAVDLAESSSGATVVHVCGPVAAPDLDAAGVRYVPEEPASEGSMSFTTGYLGPRPIVDLHAAGLRIGADLSRERRNGADLQTATEGVADLSIAMDFDEEFKRTHGFYE
jgi:hypothetical protein